MKNLKTITIPNFPLLLWRGAGGEVFNAPSLCNIPVTPNKKGNRYNSHHPNLFRIDPYVFQAQESSRRIILVILFLITKTLQMYVFF